MILKRTTLIILMIVFMSMTVMMIIQSLTRLHGPSLLVEKHSQTAELPLQQNQSSKQNKRKEKLNIINVFLFVLK